MKRSHEEEIMGDVLPSDMLPCIPSDQDNRICVQPWNLMNMDCLEAIFSYLDYVQLVKASMTCKRWQTVADYAVSKLRRFTVRGTTSEKRLRSCKDYITMFKRTYLSVLDISNNQIQAEAGSTPGYLVDAIREHCPGLRKLNASYVNFHDEASFSSMSSIIHLDLGNSNVTESMLETILVDFTALQYLNVSYNKINGHCLFHMSTTLKPWLKTLDISYNPPLEENYDMPGLIETIIQIAPNLEHLNVSGFDAEDLIEFAFDWVIRIHDYEDDEVGDARGRELALAAERLSQRPQVLESLKSLTMHHMGTGGDLEHDCNDDITRTRFPNLETLDFTANFLFEFFLENISHYCPKLRSLDISGCIVNFHILDQPINGYPESYEGCFKRAFWPMTELKILKLNGLKEMDPKSSEGNLFGVTFSGIGLQICVKHTAKLKQLKVLEMCGYPDMSNKEVAELIVGLPDLRELKIEGCSKVDNNLLTMLNAHPEFSKRRQRLLLRVHGTGMVSEGVDVQDMIRLDFMFQKKEWVSLI